MPFRGGTCIVDFLRCTSQHQGQSTFEMEFTCEYCCDVSKKIGMILMRIDRGSFEAHRAQNAKLTRNTTSKIFKIILEHCPRTDSGIEPEAGLEPATLR